MTLEEILKVLDAGSLEDLLGQEENEWLDFKSAHYDLSSAWHKSELAKDVSALANVNGGLLIVGYRTEKPVDSDREVAVELRALPHSIVSEAQYRDVIRAHVYPSLAGLDLFFAPSVDAEKRGVVAIVIPSQDAASKPFLIVHPMPDEGTHARGWMVGIVRRTFDSTDEHRIGEIHSQLSQSQVLGPRLDAIEAAVARIQPATEDERTAREVQSEEEAEIKEPRTRNRSPTQSVFHTSTTLSRIEDRLAALSPDLVKSPLFYLGATPTIPVNVPTIFRREGVRTLIEQPPVTRGDGWNLRTLNQASIERGELLSVGSGKRKHLALYGDGTFVAVAAFAGFLARDERGGHLRVHSLGLVEFTYDFVLTYAALTKMFEPQPDNALFLAGVRNARPDGKGMFLPAGPVGGMNWQFADPEDHPPIDQDSWDWDGVQLINDDAIGNTALAILERVYAAFGREFEAIPYKSEDSTGINPEIFGAQG